MWTISADLQFDSVSTFDPVVVLAKFRSHFPTTIVCLYDYARKDIELFSAMDVSQRALEAAERAAQRRGPAWLFRVYWQQVPIAGRIERRALSLTREEGPIPKDLEHSFREFVSSLGWVAPTIETRSSGSE